MKEITSPSCTIKKLDQSQFEYCRYDPQSDKVDAGYPRPIQGSWPGLWDSDIDA